MYNPNEGMFIHNRKRAVPEEKGKEICVTRDDFNRRAVRNETETTVLLDVRPFGSLQEDAVTVFLGEQEFQHSTGARKSWKNILLVVDRKFRGSAQIDGFIEHLRPGLRVSIEMR